MSRGRWALAVAGAGLCVLLFGGLLSYYGDTHVEEYRWKGPVGAILIATVCVAAVVALQCLARTGRGRSVGYVALVLLASALAFQAAATYYGERCDDPGFTDACGLPLLAAMLWSGAAATGVIALAVGAELVRRYARTGRPG